MAGYNRMRKTSIVNHLSTNQLFASPTPCMQLYPPQTAGICQLQKVTQKSRKCNSDRKQSTGHTLL